MWGGKATCVGGEKYVYVGREGHLCGRGELCVCGEGRPPVWEGKSMCMWGGKATCVGEKYVYVGREVHVCGREVCVCGEGRSRVWEGRSMCMWGGKATCVGGEKYVHKKGIVITTDSLLFQTQMSERNSLLYVENYITIFSSFPAKFPPHSDTILAISCVHALNWFTHLQQT